ncbi:ATP phosphoribosyltransferase [Zhongshania aliphaticivorans]|uniref:ATP phosphoribosyltransferase n=1 Tax=Zhongshania aliphaticivorans TaxID=1470434 RepID=A0A5S9N332_9GAMM|nr:ATP phosphoribosyltransferase [Zhongshania aliphaticivorans]CAA0083356.1 ATP phosphoribosyltransferase [Zhongshania aliphaticivorans]CAA0083436.1 ATP phosphoribosyltransferase [Zhongshania aliphaticivorans]
MDQPVTIALTKGRILKETLPLLAEAGIVPAEDISRSRKLIFETNHPHINLIVIRGTDVPTYVKLGSADIGVAGKDMLLELGAGDMYEPLDLNIARCKLMTAGRVDEPLPQGRVRVATKFVNVARRHFAERGIQVELIKLYGAMELAPLMNLADLIVDIVDTGNTLRANGMEPRDMISDVSSRLVVNKAAMKRKYKSIQDIIAKLTVAVEARRDAEEVAGNG